MGRPKVDLADYGLLLEPNICRLLCEMHKGDSEKYQKFTLALFRWVGAGCPSSKAKYIPRDLDLMAQGYLERLFTEHISRWRSYNSHRRTNNLC